MKNWIGFLGGVLLFVGAAGGNSVELSGPGGLLGFASYRGTAQRQIDYQDLDAGNGIKLPFRFIFDSGARKESPYRWTGWEAPLIESRTIPFANRFGYFEAVLVCGKRLYFQFPYRSSGGSGSGDSIGSVWLDSTAAYSQDGAWRADITGYPTTSAQGAGIPSVYVPDHYTMTMTRWDGWRLYFVDGKLSKLTTDDGTVLNWNYSGDRLTSISKGATALLQVTYAGNVPTGITLNGDAYGIQVDTSQRLTQITHPDATTDAFDYANFAGAHLASFGSTSNPANGNASLEHTNRYGFKRKLTWSPTGYHFILGDGQWDYAVTAPESWAADSTVGAPNVKRTRTAIPAEWEQIIFSGERDSIATFRGIDGAQTRTTTEKADGASREKASKVEKLVGASWVQTSFSAYQQSTGRLIRWTDANGKDTVFTYTDHPGAALPHPVAGWASSVNYAPPKTRTVTDPTGRAVTSTYDVRGNLVKVADLAGVERSFEYDTRDRLTKVRSDAGVLVAHFGYNNNDRVTSVKDSAGHETKFDYLDRHGESLPTKVTSPGGLTAEFTYDGKGNRLTAKGTNGETWTLEPNSDNLLEKITDPLTFHTDFAYDGRKNLATVTDALTHATTFESDDLDLTRKITDVLASASSFENNGNGATTKITDNRAKVYDLEYQDRFKRTKLKFPGASENVSAYDRNGRLATWKNRAGTTVTMARDDAGRLTAKSWPGGSMTYSYDTAGRLEEAESDVDSMVLTKDFSYDAEGRLFSTGGTTFHYDANGRVSKIDYPAGFSVDYAYDDDGRLFTVKIGTTVLAAYGYDPVKGQLKTITNGNGVVTTYGYDKLNHVTSISAAKGATVLWAAAYGYNALGNRIYATGLYGGGGGDAYLYDNLGQLKGVKYNTATATGGYSAATSPAATETTDYDAAGNRLSQTVGSATTTYLANDLNQYTAVTGETPTYDAMGNLTSHGGWTLTYSALGQLTSATKSGSPTQNYGYDAFGNRASEESVGNYTRQLLSVGNRLLECNETPAGSGAEVKTSYVYGRGIDRPIGQITGNLASIQYPLQDANGNVVALTNASGAVVERYTYDAWGTPKVSNASWTAVTTAPQSRFLFTGRDYDARTGLYHYRSRAYSPKLGRFLQPDTIDFYGGQGNIYNYVYNSPINFTDFFGLQAQSWGDLDWEHYYRNSTPEGHTVSPNSPSGRIGMSIMVSGLGALTGLTSGLAIAEFGPLVSATVLSNPALVKMMLDSGTSNYRGPEYPLSWGTGLSNTGKFLWDKASSGDGANVNTPNSEAFDDLDTQPSSGWSRPFKACDTNADRMDDTIYDLGAWQKN